MFKYTKKEIAKFALDYNVKKNTLEKVLRLVDVLDFINNDEELKGKLALKGGTAINLTFYDYLRLSVDIDLDYIGCLDRQEMLKDRKIIEAKLIGYMEVNNYKYRKDKSKLTHSLDSFVFNFNNLFNATDMIKVEINYMNRIHIYECEYRNITFPPVQHIKVLTLNKYDLFASKMNALINRTTIRDIYDVSNMINLNTIDNNEFNSFKKCLIFYLLLSSEGKLSLSNSISDCIERIKSFENNRLPQYLTTTLKDDDKFDINDAAKKIIDLLNKVQYSLSAEEIEIINTFPYHKINLFDNPKLNTNFNNHPMIKWKQKNSEK